MQSRQSSKQTADWEAKSIASKLFFFFYTGENMYIYNECVNNDAEILAVTSIPCFKVHKLCF